MLMSVRGAALIDHPQHRVPPLDWYMSGGDIRMPISFAFTPYRRCQSSRPAR